MTRQDAERLYGRGRVPQISDLAGTWQVTMWRKWKFMRRDRKVVLGDKGHNVYYLFKFIPIKWGKFSVRECSTCLRLLYSNGLVIDYLRLHPDRNDIMLGLFNGGELFALTLINGDM
jgi:hypothetical protein